MTQNDAQHSIRSAAGWRRRSPGWPPLRAGSTPWCSPPASANTPPRPGEDPRQPATTRNSPQSRQRQGSGDLIPRNLHRRHDHPHRWEMDDRQPCQEVLAEVAMA